MSRRTTLAIASLTVLIFAGLGFVPPGEIAATGRGASARLITVREAFKAIDQMKAAGQPVSANQTYVWSSRLMEAERDAATTKPERVAAAKAHADRMGFLLREVRSLHRGGQASLMDVLEIQYHDAEALSWLEREQTR